jgi:transcriptional regulator with XRE-family HTH domain
MITIEKGFKVIIVKNNATNEMIKQSFFSWIIQERDSRHWNDSELAARAEISQSNISLIMSGQRNVTFDFCVGIARAFRIRPELVLYKAGLLPRPAITKDELNDDEIELILNRRRLPIEHQIALDNVAKGLADRFGQPEE